MYFKASGFTLELIWNLTFCLYVMILLNEQGFLPWKTDPKGLQREIVKSSKAGQVGWLGSHVFWTMKSPVTCVALLYNGGLQSMWSAGDCWMELISFGGKAKWSTWLILHSSLSNQAMELLFCVCMFTRLCK